MFTLSHNYRIQNDDDGSGIVIEDHEECPDKVSMYIEAEDTHISLELKQAALLVEALQKKIAECEARIAPDNYVWGVDLGKEGKDTTVCLIDGDIVSWEELARIMKGTH